MALGLRVPTVVQAYAWSFLTERHDTLLLSPPSSGKTLAYLLPLLTIMATDHENRPILNSGVSVFVSGIMCTVIRRLCTSICNVQSLYDK